MSPNLVRKRYTRSMLKAGAGYLFSVFAISFILDDSDPITPFTVFLSAVPGIFILFMLYAMWAYLRDTDEAARYFLTRALVGALFIALAISGVWGLMELFLDALPRLPVFYIFPLVMGAFGLLSCFGPDRGFSRA